MPCKLLGINWSIQRLSLRFVWADPAQPSMACLSASLRQYQPVGLCLMLEELCWEVFLFWLVRAGFPRLNIDWGSACSVLVLLCPFWVVFSTRTPIITQLESQGGSSVQLQRSFSLQPTSSPVFLSFWPAYRQFAPQLSARLLGSIWVPLSCATVWNLLLGIKLGLLLHCCPSQESQITLDLLPGAGKQLFDIFGLAFYQRCNY